LELVKLIVSVPPELLKLAKVLPPDSRLLPLTVKVAPEVLNPNESCAFAPPLRAIARLAPV
jgi:hypothetical protein